MKQQDHSHKVLGKTYQRWDHSKITNQDLQDLEVDTVVLSVELYRLARMCTRIIDAIPSLVQPSLEPEYQVE